MASIYPTISLSLTLSLSNISFFLNRKTSLYLLDITFRLKWNPVEISSYHDVILLFGHRTRYPVGLKLKLKKKKSKSKRKEKKSKKKSKEDICIQIIEREKIRFISSSNRKETGETLRLRLKFYTYLRLYTRDTVGIGTASLKVPST